MFRKIFMLFFAALMICPLSLLGIGGEIPPVVGTFVPPNIVIMLDNSRSMRNISWHSGYEWAELKDYDNPPDLPGYTEFMDNSGHDNPGDPENNVSYNNNGKVTKIYIYAGDYTINVKTVHLGEGMYQKKYLNWIYGYATQEQLNNIPQLSRIGAAKEAVTILMDNTTFPLRFGLALFYNQEPKPEQGYPLLPTKDGGFIAVEVDDENQDNVKTAISRIQLGDLPEEADWINWGTPLAETMCDVLDYYSGDYDDGDNIFLTGATYPLQSPVQHECQQNFLIIVTDGFTYADDFNGNLPGWLPSDGLDVEDDGLKHDPQGWRNDGHGNWGWRDYNGKGTDYLDDIAFYMANNDFCSWFEGDQKIFTYTIGFLVDFPLLVDTADEAHGNGQYFLTGSAEELAEALEDAVTDIINRTSSGTAAAVLSTSLKTGNMVFSAKFSPLNWQGFLEAYSLPYTEMSDPVWQAGVLLEARAADSRAIYTAKRSFWGQINERDVFDEYLESSMAQQQKDVINWVRGEYNAGYRDRGDPGSSEWKLGDVVYSSPIVVGPPRGPYMQSTYAQFKSDYADRDYMIYIGANDGMIHAFDALTGAERWAFVPNSFCFALNEGEEVVDLSPLESLTSPGYPDNHRYYMDLTPVFCDAYIDPDQNGISDWRTVVIFGMRQGGTSYVCLDITNPDNPLPLWENSYARMGESWCVPSVGIMNLDGYPTWVMIIGTGFDSGSDPDFDGKLRFAVVDIETGLTIGTRKMNNLTPNWTMGVANIDWDNDGYLDFLYAGDRKGRIWKYDTTTTPMFKDRLFKARTTGNVIQPINVMPTLFLDDYNRVMIQFGTGQYFHPTDRLDTTSQSFYGLIDNNSGIEISRDDLADQTDVSDLQDILGKKGFVFDLPRQGERVVTESVFFDGITFFTSFVPTSDVCAAGGDAYLYFVDFYTGAPFERAVIDTNQDDYVTDDDYVEGTRSVSLGNNPGLPSKPIISPGTNEVIIQTSDTRIRTRLFDFDVMEIISWRESLE